jgi:hypothetical protein
MARHERPIIAGSGYLEGIAGAFILIAGSLVDHGDQADLCAGSEKRGGLDYDFLLALCSQCISLKRRTICLADFDERLG